MLAQLNAHYPWLIQIFVLMLGACWGSFLNVVVYRVPLGKSLVFPGSSCPACNTPIKIYDNVPVLGWLMLLGRARCCKAPISPRYPLIEALTALLFLFTWNAYGASAPWVVVVGWVLVSLLLAGALIDFDTQLLPDFFTVWGMGIGIAASLLVPALHGVSDGVDPALAAYGIAVPQTPPLLFALQGGAHAVLGAVVGAGTLLWIAVVAETLLRKEAMGFGDVLLMGCIGAFCGWQGAVFAIFGGALIGSVAVLTITLLNAVFGLKLGVGKTTHGPAAFSETEKTDSTPATDANANAHANTDEASNATAEASGEVVEKIGLGVAIPFGPWLAAGALVYFLFLREQTDSYLAQLTQLLFGH